MKMPMYVQKPIYTDLQEMVGEANDFGFMLESAEIEFKVKFHLSVAFEQGEHGETAIISIRSQTIPEENELGELS